MSVIIQRVTRLFLCLSLLTWLQACGGGGGGGGLIVGPISVPIVSSWTRVDGGTGAGINFSASLDSNSPTGILLGSKVYLAWIEENSSNLYQVRARVYNGNDTSPSFAPVDGGDPNTGLNVDPTQSAVTIPRMAILNNKLYLSWQEPTSTSSLVHVAVYNGNDGSPAWTGVDGSGASGPTGGINYKPAKLANAPVLATNNGKLYAIWYEAGTGSVYQVRVAVYNGNDSAPVWSMVDGNSATGLNFNTTDTVGYVTMVSANGKLYAAWSETLNYSLHVRVYNGNDSAPSWKFVDGDTAAGINHSASAKATSTALAVSNSKLYAVWTETASGGIAQIRAAVYGGNDSAPAWAFVDGNGANGINIKPGNNASTPTIADYGGVLYAAWKEQLGNGGGVYGIHVAHLGGTDAAPVWTEVDQGNLSFSQSDNAEFPSLIPAAERLYCAWDEESVPGKGQIHVSSGM